MLRRGFAMLCVAAMAAVACGNLGAAEIEVGAKAPEFKATGVDGKEYSLSSASKDAKAVVVCFTCNNCPMAVAYEDRFIDFAKNYADKGVKFIAINVNSSEDLEKMKVRNEEKGFNYPYAFDKTGDSARAFGARVTPHLFVIDGDGKVAYRGSFDDKNQNPSKHYVADAVDAVLAGKSPEVATTSAFGCGIRPNKPQQ